MLKVEIRERPLILYEGTWRAFKVFPKTVHSSKVQSNLFEIDFMTSPIGFVSYGRLACVQTKNMLKMKFTIVFIIIFQTPEELILQTFSQNSIHRSIARTIQCNFQTNTAQKIKFSVKDFFSKCDQIRSFLWNP